MRGEGLAVAAALLVVGVVAGTHAAGVNLALVDVNQPNNELDDQALAGFVAALEDAKLGKHNLFPSHALGYATRVVHSERANSAAFTRQLVEMGKGDDAAGLVGCSEVQTAMLAQTVLAGFAPRLPRASVAPLSRLPAQGQSPWQGATPNVRVRLQALAKFLQASNLTAVTLLVEDEAEMRAARLVASEVLRDHALRVAGTLSLPPSSLDEASASRVFNQTWERVADDGNRVVLVLASVEVLEAALASAHASALLPPHSPLVWLYWRADTITQHLHAHDTHAELADLVANAHLIGPAVHGIDAESDAIVALRATLSALPESLRDAVFPELEMPATGVPQLTAFAYDSAMGLLRALNQSLALGNAAGDHEAVLEQMRALDFEGVSGGVKYSSALDELATTVDLVQLLPNATATTTTGYAVRAVVLATLDPDASALTQRTAAWWPGAAEGDATPPDNFFADGCGLLAYRTRFGFCLACPPQQLNAQDDGSEACSPCAFGTEMRGAECVPCGDDETAVWSKTAPVPLCQANPKHGVNIAMVVAIVGACIVAALLLGCVVGMLRLKMLQAEDAHREAELHEDTAHFVAFSFHEMRNPLNGVSGGIEFALASLQDALDEMLGGPEERARRDKRDAERRAKRKTMAGIRKTDPQEVVPVKKRLGDDVIEVRAVQAKVLDIGKSKSKSKAQMKRLASDAGNDSDSDVDPVDRLRDLLVDLKDGQLCLVDTVHVLDSINLLSQLINQVCALERVPTCIRELVEETTHMAKELVSDSLVDIDVEVVLDGKKAKRREFLVMVDRPKLRQTLLVLLLNALHYTEKGKVRVRAVIKSFVVPGHDHHHHHHLHFPHLHLPHLHLPHLPHHHGHGHGHGHGHANGANDAKAAAKADKAHPGGDAGDVELGLVSPRHKASAMAAIHFEVEDTGRGIPASDLRQIFDLQHQIQRGGTVRSTGLGLVLAAEIVALHGGTMFVESRHLAAVGQGESGTRFWWDMHARAINGNRTRKQSTIGGAGRRESEGEGRAMQGVAEEEEEEEEDEEEEGPGSPSVRSRVSNLKGMVRQLSNPWHASGSSRARVADARALSAGATLPHVRPGSAMVAGPKPHHHHRHHHHNHARANEAGKPTGLRALSLTEASPELLSVVNKMQLGSSANRGASRRVAARVVKSSSPTRHELPSLLAVPRPASLPRVPIPQLAENGALADQRLQEHKALLSKGDTAKEEEEEDGKEEGEGAKEKEGGKEKKDEGAGEGEGEGAGARGVKGNEAENASRRASRRASRGRGESPQPLPRTSSKPTSQAESVDTIAELLEGVRCNLRVLLLEDVPLNRKVMRRKLSMHPFDKLGWAIDECETGEKCLHMIIEQGKRYDIVFCDQILSHAGGKLLGSETAQILREWERNRDASGEGGDDNDVHDHMVLLACSGNASDEDKKVYTRAGMNGVIPKPLPNQVQLLRAVRGFVLEM